MTQFSDLTWEDGDNQFEVLEEPPPVTGHCLACGASVIEGDCECWCVERDDLDVLADAQQAREAVSRAEAEALDELAALFRKPNWQIRGSGASFIEACAEIVARVRDIEAPS